MKKIVLWLIATLVAFVGLALLFTPWLVGFFAIANDDLLLRDAYNNPIINGGYAGWQEVSVAEGASFMLPEGWTLAGERTALVITDQDGGIVARGYVCSGSHDPQPAIAAMSGLTGFPVTGADCSTVPEFIQDQVYLCSLKRVVAHGDGQQSILYSLHLTGKPCVHLYFPNCHGAAFTALIDQAEAIVYSYLYGTTED